MRPEAPTLPVAEHEAYEDGEERTQLRAPPSIDPATTRFKSERHETTLEQEEDEQAELLARVEQLARLDTTARMDRSGMRPIAPGAATAKLEQPLTRSGINEIVRRPDEDRTRVGAPRPVLSKVVALPTPVPPMQSPPMAYAPTQMHMQAPVAVVAPPHALPVLHAPNVIPGYVVATPATVPPPPVTARKAPPKKSGARVATFLFGMAAVGMAVVALAESPLGYRPEVAPYARIVRTEARSAALKVRHGVLDLVARVKAP